MGLHGVVVDVVVFDLVVVLLRVVVFFVVLVFVAVPFAVVLEVVCIVRGGWKRLGLARLSRELSTDLRFGCCPRNENWNVLASGRRSIGPDKGVDFLLRGDVVNDKSAAGSCALCVRGREIK